MKSTPITLLFNKRVTAGLFWVGNNVVEMVGVTFDREVKALIAVNPSLPHVEGLVIFLCL